MTLSADLMTIVNGSPQERLEAARRIEAHRVRSNYSTVSRRPAVRRYDSPPHPRRPRRLGPLPLPRRRWAGGGGVAMNHKRRRPKNRRAGCLMCKPNKANGARLVMGPRPGVVLRLKRAMVSEREQRGER